MSDHERRIAHERELLLLQQQSGRAWDNINQSVRDGITDLEAYRDAVGGIATESESAGNIVQRIGQQAGDTWTAFAQTLSTMVPNALRKSYRAIQTTYGGLGEDILEPTNAMAQKFQGVTRNTFSEWLTTSSEYEIYGMGLTSVFKNVNEAMLYFNDIATDQVNSFKLMKTANEDLAIEMGLFGQGLGYTAEQTSTFVQREISLTGEASGQMLREAAVFSNKIAAQTGDSAKMIAQNVEAIIANTEDFGNVTVEEAARMSAAIRQLGIDYSDLSGMVGQFQSFDQAANSVSALTTVFGVQLDAMELMRLANEDQEGFLRRVRQDFLATGKAVDDLSLAEKRLIQQQLGLSDVESVERLLDPTATISSFEELANATAGAGTETSDAMRAVEDDLVVIDEAAAMTAEAIRTHMELAFREGMIDEAMAAEQAFVRFAGRATEALVDPTNSIDDFGAAIDDLFSDEGGRPLFTEDQANALGRFLGGMSDDLRTTAEDMFGEEGIIETEAGRLVTRWAPGGEGNPLQELTEIMTTGFVTGWTSAFGNINSAWNTTLRQMHQNYEDSGGAGSSESEWGTRFRDGFESSWAIMTDSWRETLTGMGNITAEQMTEQLRDTDGALANLTRELSANIGANERKQFEELTDETKESIRDRLRRQGLLLGDDWADELRAMMTSTAYAQGGQIAALEGRIRASTAGLPAEELGLRERTDMQAEYGFQSLADLDRYLSLANSTVELNEQQQEDMARLLRDAARRKVLGPDEEEGEGESGDRTASREQRRRSAEQRTQREQQDSEHLEQIAQNTGADQPIHVTVNLDSRALIDSVVTARGAGTNGSIVITGVS